MKKKNTLDKVIEKLNMHSRKFGYYYIPDREVIIDVERSKELISLINKSLQENIDYLLERYNVDVAKHKEPAPKIIYD